MNTASIYVITFNVATSFAWLNRNKMISQLFKRFKSHLDWRKLIIMPEIKNNSGKEILGFFY